MGVTLSGGFTNPDGAARAKGILFQACIAEAMDKAMKFGVHVGQDTIETSGTGYQGRRGRVVTGDMRDHFDGKVAEQNQTRVVGDLGWLESSPFYALFQEYGFRHWISGNMVEGMHALREAGDQAWDEFKKNAAICVREVYGK